MNKIKYLGSIINAEGIRIDSSMVEKAVLNMIPKTKQQLQKLIVTFNWARSFIQNLSQKMKFLTDKLGLPKYSWTNEDNTNLTNLKY